MSTKFNFRKALKTTFSLKELALFELERFAAYEKEDLRHKEFALFQLGFKKCEPGVSNRQIGRLPILMQTSALVFSADTEASLCSPALVVIQSPFSLRSNLFLRSASRGGDLNLSACSGDLKFAPAPGSIRLGNRRRGALINECLFFRPQSIQNWEKTFFCWSESVASFSARSSSVRT